MQDAPEIVFGIPVRPDRIYDYLMEAIILSGKLILIKTTGRRSEEIRIKLATYGKDECIFDATVSYDDDNRPANLHLKGSSPKDSERLAEAAAEMTRAIVKYNHWLAERFEYEEKLKVSDPHIERVATFLEDHPMSTLEQISQALAMLHVSVATSLSLLAQKGIVGCTPSNISPRKFFVR